MSRLRSAEWYAGDDRNAYIHRAWMRRGLPDVPRAELDARPPSQALLDGLARPRRGWERLYVDTVLGADTGADCDFLLGSSGPRVSRESH